MMRTQSHFVRPAIPLSGTLQTGRVARNGGPQYAAGVAETTATGFDSLTIGGQPPQRGFFTSVRLRAPFQWAGLGGEGFGPAGSNPGLSTLPCARSPHLTVDSGLSILIGGRTMRQLTHAHSGQNPALIQSIIRDALRAAATADTYQSALDATGAALVAISLLVRAEVRNG